MCLFLLRTKFLRFKTFIIYFFNLNLVIWVTLSQAADFVATNNPRKWDMVMGGQDKFN